MSRRAALFLAVMAISCAYLAYAVRKMGRWGGVLFIAIWTGVFVSQSRKAEQR